MFGKKILSIVGLLFLGSQISFVKAGAGCQITVTGCDTNNCQCALGTNSDDCHDGFYAIASGNGENKNANEGIDGVLIELSGIGTTNTCSFRSDVGYFMSGESTKIISNSHDGKANAITLTDKSTCTESGNINASSQLCIQNGDTGVISLSDSDNDIHLITNGASKIFNSDSTAKVAIKVQANSFTLDTTKNGNEYNVADSVVGEPVTSEDQRKLAFCNGNTIYKCTEGVCTTELSPGCIRSEVTKVPCNPKSAPGECEAGYYIVGKTGNDNADELLTSGEGDLYYCSAKGQCDGGAAVTPANYPTGYLVNADTDNSGTISYIKCINGDKCYAINLTTETDSCSKAGDIINKTGSGVKFCITTGKDVEIDTSSKYFICYETGIDNAFTDVLPSSPAGVCGIFEMSSTGITLKARVGATSPKYRYTDDNQKIYDTQSDDICKNGNITEFSLEFCNAITDDKTDYYIKGTPTHGPLGA